MKQFDCYNYIKYIYVKKVHPTGVKLRNNIKPSNLQSFCVQHIKSMFHLHSGVFVGNEKYCITTKIRYILCEVSKLNKYKMIH